MSGTKLIGRLESKDEEVAPETATEPAAKAKMEAPKERQGNARMSMLVEGSSAKERRQRARAIAQAEARRVAQEKYTAAEMQWLEVRTLYHSQEFQCKLANTNSQMPNAKQPTAES